MIFQDVAENSLKGYNYMVSLSSRFFCIDTMLLCELKAIRYGSTSLNRIVADKSHCVIVA